MSYVGRSEDSPRFFTGHSSGKERAPKNQKQQKISDRLFFVIFDLNGFPQ
jgi:hypothetical protein